MNPLSLRETSLSDIVDKNNLNVKGDTALLSISKKSQFSKQQLVVWYEELKLSFPEMDEALIKTVIEAYSTHPHIIDDLAVEHKQNPEAFCKREDVLEFAENSGGVVVE